MASVQGFTQLQAYIDQYSKQDFKLNEEDLDFQIENIKKLLTQIRDYKKWFSSPTDFREAEYILHKSFWGFVNYKKIKETNPSCPCLSCSHLIFNDSKRFPFVCYDTSPLHPDSDEIEMKVLLSAKDCMNKTV